MRIIHGSDYYDNAHAGIDTSIFFVRNGEAKKEIGFDDFPFSPKNLHGTLCLVYVFFAGEVYPAMRVPKDKDRHPDAAADFFMYNKFGMQQFEFIYDGTQARKMYEDFAAEKWSINIDAYRAAVMDHFQTKNPKWNEWLISHGVVTGYVQLTSEGRELISPHLQPSKYQRDFSHQVGLQVNGDFMKDLNFVAVMDPFTANQAVAQYVGGVLPANQAGTVALSNLDRVRKAGFDTKTSFRKGPQA